MDFWESEPAKTKMYLAVYLLRFHVPHILTYFSRAATITVWAINSWYWLWNQIPQLLGLGLICPFIFKICRHISTVDAIKSPSQSNQAHDMCQSFKLLRNQKSILGLEAFWISEYQYCFEHLYHCATRYLPFKSN